jgi:hypothetical protein
LIRKALERKRKQTRILFDRVCVAFGRPPGSAPTQSEGSRVVSVSLGLFPCVFLFWKTISLVPAGLTEGAVPAEDGGTVLW